MASMSSRDPYPFPRLENDQTFSYHGRIQQVAPKDNSWTVYRNSQEVFAIPTHLAQEQDPWKRLNWKHTLSSSRHEVYHFDPKAPSHSLDYALRGKYCQHADVFKNKNEVVFQRETFDEDHWGRKLKNRNIVEPKRELLLNHPLVMEQQNRRVTIQSVKQLAIAGDHSEETNNGYSRKSDGGFFVF